MSELPRFVLSSALRRNNQKSEIEIIGIGNHPSHGLKERLGGEY